jgi:hypothetical protein
MSREVYCANCGVLLGVEAPLSLHQRGRCGWCGSTARRTETTVTDSVQMSDSIQLTGIEVTPKVGTPRVWGSPATVREIERHLYWMEPTDHKGSYTASVWDQDGNLIAAAEKPTADAALSVVLLALLPQKES